MIGDKFMLRCSFWRQALVRIPAQASFEEAQKDFVLSLNQALQ